MRPTAVLLFSCPDQQGLVAKIANFIYANGGNVIHAAQHTDLAASLFLTRIEWELDGFNLPRDIIAPDFEAIAQPLQARWQIRFSDAVPRMAIWVTKQDHCLLDLLWRQQAKEFSAHIPLIVSNHERLRPIAEQFDIDYHCLPVRSEIKTNVEAAQLALLAQYQIDLVVLAKYMQVLSPSLLGQFSQVINIHHSFLPAFAGANPYKRAHERGVKIIGATAHYATVDLDEGPIPHSALQIGISAIKDGFSTTSSRTGKQSREVARQCGDFRPGQQHAFARRSPPGEWP